MELAGALLDLLVNLDRHLVELLRDHGGWVYLILFAVIFCETGLVVTPFLPGDSLLFVAGTVAATGALEVQWLAPLLVVAAFSGDNTNYWIGRYAGPRVFTREGSRLLNPAYLARTRAFYERHGGKTVIFARFAPILRTYVPFVAGIGAMSYPRFLAFSALGSVAWIGCFVLGGYWFGGVPVVKQNLAWFILGIVLVSLSPAFLHWLRARARPKDQ